MSTTRAAPSDLRPAPPPAGRADAAGAEAYRYPGTFSFQDSDLDRRLFRGRAEESAEVLHAILSSDLLVLYAPSGTGKTSLLNAGVLEQLRRRGYWPVSVRLNDPAKDPVQTVHERIVETASRDDSVDVEVAPGSVEPIDRSLWDLLSALEVWRGNKLLEPVLVLDQFEELFTLGWSAEARARFTSDLGEVLRGHRAESPTTPTEAVPSRRRPHARFVLVIREDSLGELEAMSQQIPQILANRFRLGALTTRQAAAAIREPAHVADSRLASERFEYSDAAVEEMLGFLRSHGRDAAAVDGDGIDPSQLQIVCQHVERAILPTKSPPRADGASVRIEADDLGGHKGLELILSAFYRRTVESFPERQRKPIRRLCEKGLINPQGRRLSLERGQIEQDYAVGEALLAELVDRRLLRAEYRPGLDMYYYELAHDTLIDPIRADRQARALDSSRRRQRILLGVAALAVLALIGGVLAWRTWGGPQTLAFDAEPVRGSAQAGGKPAVFNLEANSQAGVVTVTPVGLPSIDPVIEVRTPDGVTRQQNLTWRGQQERIFVVPAVGDRGTSRVSVVSGEGTAGEFDISWGVIPTPTPVTSGSSLAGRVRRLGDFAVFLVDASDSGPVRVQVEPDGDFDAELEVLDARGASTRMDSSEQGGREETFLVGSSGPDHVVVRGYEGSTGSFTVSTSPIEAASLVSGQPLEGQLEPGGQAWFTVDPPGEAQTLVRVQPADTLDVFVRTAASGQAPWSRDGEGAGGQEVVLLPASTGRQLVSVEAAGGDGEFSIQADPVTPERVQIGREKTRAGIAVYSGTVAGSALVTVAVEPESPDTGLTVILTDSGGSILGQGNSDGESAARVLGLVSAAYRVIVLPDGSGDYTVRVDEVPPPRTLRAGREVTGSGLSSYGVTVADDEIATVEVVPESPGTRLDMVVLDADGYEVDTASSADGAVAGVSLWGGATYQVVVIPDGSGDYTVSAERIEPTTLEVGAGPVVGAGVSSYGVTVAEGQVMVVEVVPESPDTSLSVDVLDASEWPGWYDGSASGVWLASPGTYQVVVAPDGPGGYSVSLGELPPSRPVQAGEEVTGAGVSGYGVTAAEGQVMVVEAVPESPDGALVLVLLDADGSEVSRAWGDVDVPARVWIPGPATPLVIVAPDGPGGHRVSVESTAFTTLDVTDPVRLPGEITEAGAVAVYAFEGDGEPRVVRVLPGVGLDAVLSVTEPGGISGSSDGEAPTDTEQVETAGLVGTHLLVVQGFGDTVGGFVLEVTR